MGALEDRLAALSQRGSPACVALWVERQGADAAVETLAGRTDPLSRLQYARLLVAGNQPGHVARVLGSLAGLPAGLAAFRAELSERSVVSGQDDGYVPIQMPEDTGVPVKGLEGWLTRVQTWRATLGV